MQALELHQDLNNISQTYMQDPTCGFWVAEVVEVSEANELDALVNKTKKVRLNSEMLMRKSVLIYNSVDRL